MSDQKCPKCGSAKNSFIEPGFECGTYIVLEDDTLTYKHTASCLRLTTLEAENARLREENTKMKDALAIELGVGGTPLFTPEEYQKFRDDFCKHMEEFYGIMSLTNPCR